MREIVGDATIGANFVVLLIVKLSPGGALLTSVDSYLPNGDRIPASLRLVGNYFGAIPVHAQIYDGPRWPGGRGACQPDAGGTRAPLTLRALAS